MNAQSLDQADQVDHVSEKHLHVEMKGDAR